MQQGEGEENAVEEKGVPLTKGTIQERIFLFENFRNNHKMSLAAWADWWWFCLCVRQIGRLKGYLFTLQSSQGILEWLEWYHNPERVHSHSLRHFVVQQTWRSKLAVINEIFAFPRRQQKQFIEFELAKVWILNRDEILHTVFSFSYLQLLDLSFNKLIDLSNCNFPMLKSKNKSSRQNIIL